MGDLLKKGLVICSLIFLMAVPSHADKKQLKRGMRLYKQHRYEEAVHMLYDHLQSNSSGQLNKIHLGLAMSCLANAELYRELYHAALAFNLDYYSSLSKVDGPYKSHFANLYLGRTLLESGELIEASGFLQKFLADQTIAALEQEMARINIGIILFLEGQQDKAFALWSKVNLSQPEVLFSLAATYSRFRLPEKNPLAMCNSALRLLRQSGNKPSIQMISQILCVYAAEGLIDEGLALIKRADLKAYFHEETPIANKVIRFYDSALLRNLSLFYGKAAISFLNKAYSTADRKVKALAQYYLSEAYELCGSADQSMKIVDELIAGNGSKPQFITKAKIRRAANLHAHGNQEAAREQMDALLKFENEPNLIADMLLACIQYNFDYNPVVINAAALAHKGEGRAFSRVNYALGKFYLWKNDYLKAIDYMEAGRDKSNKNRIEVNDPLMLVNLAEAYYRSKQFSEALEIFFEMSKQFPAVRQIQDALQGVYSIEQKSAGDAKIF
jgi:hypothetical protein